jgi:cysteine desulfurase
MVPNETLSYFDNNATTRVAPEVVETMLPFLKEFWGNPSSAYWFGHQLSTQLDEARNRVAALLNAEPRELVFTSGGTESNNAAIQSAACFRPEKRHVITTAVEHPSVLRFCQVLRRQGCETTFLPVDAHGNLDIKDLERALRPDTALVSVMYANNETGVLFPIEEISALCRDKDVLFHTDAVQAAGKLPLDVKQLGVDFLSLSAHKLHAPKGIGVLYIKRGVGFHPYIVGGSQERGRRGGTENVANIAAFGRAAELALNGLTEEVLRMKGLRDRLEKGILAKVPGCSLNGVLDSRLPNTTNITFDGVEAEGILMLLDQAGICASSGSACATGSLEPSHVLVAMGRSAASARSSVRFSLGRYNTEAEVGQVLEKLPPIVAKLRAASSSPAA